VSSCPEEFFFKIVVSNLNYKCYIKIEYSSHFVSVEIHEDCAFNLFLNLPKIFIFVLRDTHTHISFKKFLEFALM
jgi:hypothetical protein